MVSGADPFCKPPPHSVSFFDNQSVSVAGLSQSEINATNGTVINFNSGDYSFDLNVSSSLTSIRIEIPYGAVEKMETSVVPEPLSFVAESLLRLKRIYLPGIPWTNLLVRNYMILEVVTGMEIIMELRATVPGSGDVDASSSNGSFPATNAFDDGGNTSDSRWLAHGNHHRMSGFP